MSVLPIDDAVEQVLLMWGKRTSDAPPQSTEETLELLEGLGYPADAMALELAAAMKGELHEAESIEDLIGQLKQRAHKHKVRAEELLGFIEHFHPNAPGSATLHDARVEELRWKTNPPKVKLTGDVPAGYLRQPPVPEKQPDKKRIAADLKAGKALVFAELERESVLVVK